MFLLLQQERQQSKHSTLRTRTHMHGSSTYHMLARHLLLQPSSAAAVLVLLLSPLKQQTHHQKCSGKTPIYEAAAQFYLASPTHPTHSAVTDMIAALPAVHPTLPYLESPNHAAALPAARTHDVPTAAASAELVAAAYCKLETAAPTTSCRCCSSCCCCPSIASSVHSSKHHQQASTPPPNQPHPHYTHQPPQLHLPLLLLLPAHCLHQRDVITLEQDTANRLAGFALH
jgi:hypothetical protein